MRISSEFLPKAIALKTPNDQQVGFVLTSLNPTEKETEFRGECVFMFLPENGAVIESELGIIISELKLAGEHACCLQVIDENMRIVVSPKHLPSLELVIGSDGRGTLSTTERGVARQVGVVDAARAEK